MSRSAEPPKPRRPGAPKRGSFVDADGRWRDAQGHFIPRATLFRGFFPGSFEDTSIYLYELADRIVPPRDVARADRYLIAGRFLGLADSPAGDWRMLSNAHGLRSAVAQAAGRIVHSKKFNRYTLATEGHVGPLVIYELALHKLGPAKGPSTAKNRGKRKAAEKKARKRKKGSSP